MEDVLLVVDVGAIQDIQGIPVRLLELMYLGQTLQSEEVDYQEEEIVQVIVSIEVHVKEEFANV